MYSRLTHGLALALLVLSAPAVADTLVIDAVETAPALERPYKGQAMPAVEAHFGAPRQTLPAIGQPPISRWVYDGFTVYFEGDKVLHSVVHR